MTLSDILSAVALLGLGGVVGAIASAIAAGSGVTAAFEAFRSAYKDYKADKTRENESALAVAFDGLDGAISGFGSAFERLRRALRRR